MIETRSVDADGVRAVVDVLRTWQDDRVSPQLHPGDIGWSWRRGREAVATALRVWQRDGRAAAIGLQDGPDLFRLAIDPALLADEELAIELADDLTDPGRGVLPAGELHLEVAAEALLRRALEARGWRPGVEWTAVRRRLDAPVEDAGVRIEIAGQVPAGAAGTGASTDRTADRWRALASAIPFPEARCLIAHNDEQPVGVIVVWAAGPGRPGVITPFGVEPAFRGKGFGRALVLAGAATLREFGASSVLTAAESFNRGALRTYATAGFEPLAPRRDLDRPA